MFPRRVPWTGWFLCILCILCVCRVAETLRFLGSQTLLGRKCPPWTIATTHIVLCVKMILSLCTCASPRASVYCHSWRIVYGKDVRVDLLPPAPQGSDPTNQRLSGHPLLLQHSSFSLYSTSDMRFPFSFSTLYSIASCLSFVVSDGLSIKRQMVGH